jgi:hypothetical protein
MEFSSVLVLVYQDVGEGDVSKGCKQRGSSIQEPAHSKLSGDEHLRSLFLHVTKSIQYGSRFHFTRSPDCNHSECFVDLVQQVMCLGSWLRLIYRLIVPERGHTYFSRNTAF